MQKLVMQLMFGIERGPHLKYGKNLRVDRVICFVQKYCNRTLFYGPTLHIKPFLQTYRIKSHGAKHQSHNILHYSRYYRPRTAILTE